MGIHEPSVHPGVRPGLISTPAGDAPPPGGNILQLTYGELETEFLRDCENKSRIWNTRWSLGEWLKHVGLTADSVVGDELLFGFDAHLKALQHKLSTRKAESTASTLVSRMRAVRTSYLKILHGGDLPESFVDAISVGLKRTGRKPHDLRIDLCETAYHWALSNTTPKRNASLDLVHRLEEYLGLPKESLVVRAHRKPIKLKDLSRDIPWRRYLAVVKKHRIRLRDEDMPSELQAAIQQLIEHKRASEHMLPDGEIVALPAKLRWNSPETVSIYMDYLRNYFGFLVLPKASRPDSELGWEERMDHGMGLKPETLRFTMLLNKTYLFAFLRYSESRSFDKEAFDFEERLKVGKVAPGTPRPGKSLSASFHSFIILVNNLVNKSYSFLRLHPEFAAEAGVSEDEWGHWLDRRHKEILSIATASRAKVKHQKRSNKEVLQPMLRDENPLDLMHQVVEQMRRDVPPETAPVWRAAHLRDIAIISLLLFDPLRMKNIWMMDIGRQLKENEDGRLVIDIPEHEFKNHIHGHAEARYRVLPPEVEADMRAWLAMRSNIPEHKTTDAVFIRARNLNLKRERAEPARMSRHTLHTMIVKHSQNYLGLAIGLHSFRNLHATAVARVGTPSQVKAMLNNSEAIAMEVYRDAKNSDEFKALDAIYDALKPGGRKTGS